MRTQARFSTEGHPDEILHTVLTALSAAENVGVASLDLPLFDVIDSGALEQLLGNADRRISVTFPYEQWVVKAHGDGAVEVRENTETR
ncbi:hypothetical protein HUG10_12560 [Halorarum halophilum]|uniref:Halobacterial output domain-containing protein n=1 Tax=Halorarum halophilum TaxID=2743090 RepID=A0A7D5GCM0_9EURY|nr:HalOD1 output domain-containing protein [Halobaculum halophilum]QLG28325.1 hypothetical protein HUG10_12560 [Halobaculum halophilum]